MATVSAKNKKEEAKEKNVEKGKETSEVKKKELSTNSKTIGSNKIKSKKIESKKANLKVSDTKKSDLTRIVVKKSQIAETAVAKLIVDHRHEITDVIDSIQDNPASRLIISIPSGSDLLLSTVSLKLIQRTVKALQKKAVLVTDDPSGQRMAHIAGFSVRPSINEVSDDIWSRLENNEEKSAMSDSVQNDADAPSKMTEELNWSVSTESDEAESDGMSSNDDIYASIKGDDINKAAVPEDDSGDFINRDFQDDLGIIDEEDPTVHPSDKDMIDARKEEQFEKDRENLLKDDENKDDDISWMKSKAIGKDISGPTVSSASIVSTLPVGSSTRKVSDGDFEMTIDNGIPPKVLDRNKPVGKVTTPVSTKNEPKPQPRNLLGRDFFTPDVSAKERGGVKPMSAGASSYDSLPLASQEGKKKGESAVGSFISGLKSVLPIDVVSKYFAGDSKKKIGKILIPIFIFVTLILIAMFWYLPEVLVSIKVESIPVNFEGEVTASLSADRASTDNLLIPAKEEIVTKNGSDNGTASGTAVQGEKASGQVIIFNKSFEEEITIPAGTILSNGGLNFVLEAQVILDPVSTLSPTTSAYGTVIAEAIGPEYNTDSGTEFVVGTYALGQVSAANSAKFTGGTKTESKVISQEDIDKVAKTIEKTLNESATNELKQKAQGNRWIFVENSLVHKREGDVKSDVPVGAQEENVNVTLDTKSSALYYDSEALNRTIEDLLLENFEDSNSMQGLKLSDDLEKEVSIKSVDTEQGLVVISVKVSGFVMPELDEEKIENALVGRTWADGIRYLKDLDYVSGEPDLTFYPAWFPKFMRRMPGRQGRIRVRVRNVAPSSQLDLQDSEQDSEVENE